MNFHSAGGSSGGGGSTTLAGDTDVTITTPADGQLLSYNAASSKWENAAPPSGGASVPLGAVHTFGVSQPGVLFSFACSPVNSGGSIGGPYGSNPGCPGPPPYSFRLQAASTYCSYSDQANQITPATMAQIQFYAAMGQVAAFRSWLGFATSMGSTLAATDPATSLIAFRFDTSVDTDWQAYVGNGSAQTVASTAIVPDTNFHQWRIAQDGSGGWNYYIDDALVANIPASSPGMPTSTQLMAWVAEVDSDSITANLYLNAMQWWSTF
jgi:hypothetical protein